MLAAPPLAQALQIPKVLPAKGFFGEEASPEQYQHVIQSFLRSFPSLKDVKVIPTPHVATGAYHPTNKAVLMGTANPAILAHELGHAANIRPGSVYDKILKASRVANKLNATVAVPVALGIRLLTPPETANQILNYAALASAVLAAPTLAEEFGATVHAVKHAPEKLKALKTLVPAYLTHTLVQTAPFGIYQLTKATL